MRRYLVVTIMAIAVVSGLMPALPAQAVTGTAVVNPAEGGTVVTGFTTFSVQMNEPAGNYHLLVFGCDSRYHRWVDFVHDGTSRRVTLTFPALTCAGWDYHANLFSGTSTDPGNETEFITGNGFRVRTPAPRPAIESFSLSESTIWPAVIDGYKDDVQIQWDVANYEDRVRVDILDPRGQIVASRYDGIGYWTWKGRTDGRVRVGRYQVRIMATNEDGVSVQQIKPLRVRHGRMPGTRTYDYAGTSATRRTVKGNCFKSRSGSELTLDCWNGAYAEAVFDFRVHKKARGLKWRVAGRNNCCDRGTVTKTGRRVSPTIFRVTVRVTGWRSYTIRRVRLRYEARMMFREQSVR